MLETLYGFKVSERGSKISDLFFEEGFIKVTGEQATFCSNK
jgi:hypothetical protein